MCLVRGLSMQKLLVFAFIFGVSLFLGRAEADNVIISGSSTVYSAYFHDRLDWLQQATDLDVSIHVSSSGRGLMALANNEIDIAMISSDFVSLIDKVNREYQLNIQANNYVYQPLDDSHILFVVNRENPIDQLTLDQIRDILTGKIDDWSDLGHPDLGPIRVVMEHQTGGIYSTIQQQLNQGKNLIEQGVVTVQNAPQVALVVSQVKQSIGFLSNQTPTELLERVKPIDYGEKRISQTLGLVYHKKFSPKNTHKILEYVKKEQRL